MVKYWKRVTSVDSRPYLQLRRILAHGLLVAKSMCLGDTSSRFHLQGETIWVHPRCCVAEAELSLAHGLCVLQWPHVAFGDCSMIALHDVIEATGGQIVGQVCAERFADFCYDSRIARPGELFLAVVTDTGDGHDYILDACAHGITGVICQRLPPGERPDNVTWIVVENTQAALLDYARHVLGHGKVKSVGITGSVGKTTTKEAIAAVLNVREPVFRNQGSYNGRYGLPIALGRLGDERVAVLEMASDSLDEIRQLAEIVRPSVAVVTRVGHSHLDALGDIDAVAAEKCHLVKALPSDGHAVLNYDDERVRAMAGATSERVITYGQSPLADVWADDVHTGLEGTRCTIHFEGHTQKLTCSLVGAHHVYTMLAAFAVGRLWGLTEQEIVQGLASLTPLPGRLHPLPGIGGSLILDDSFNASPESAAAALQTLTALPARRRFVILGDMADLGRMAEAAHRELGQQCAKAADWLLCKGDLAQIAANEAMHAGIDRDRVLVSFSDEEIVSALQPELGEGDVVLIKGSAASRLERITARLLHPGTDPVDVLPRQGPGWDSVTLRRPGRPTWVEVDLSAIANNTRRLVERIGDNVALMAVLKADAYGHGAYRVSRTVLNSGAQWLGVACLGEAIALRQAGIDAPILNLGYAPPWQARDAVRHDVVSTVFSLDVAEALSRAARDLARQARVHVKVDTGMGRLGLLPDDAVAFIGRLSELTGVETDGVFSHLAAADEADLAYTQWQLSRFEEVLQSLSDEGLLPRWVHIANSAATVRLASSHHTMVRAGIMLYGLSPSAETPCPPNFRPALAFKCQVAQVKDLPAGSYIGYGRTFQTVRDTRIAVIPVGYADGFRRGPRTWPYVLIRGRRAPLVGAVCMDQTMLDVTDIPDVREGDEVVLIGTQGGETLSADMVAEALGTINYEVISEILARVPRMV